jgi:hypothetical protein
MSHCNYYTANAWLHTLWYTQSCMPKTLLIIITMMTILITWCHTSTVTVSANVCSFKCSIYSISWLVTIIVTMVWINQWLLLCRILMVIKSRTDIQYCMHLIFVYSNINQTSSHSTWMAKWVNLVQNYTTKLKKSDSSGDKCSICLHRGFNFAFGYGKRQWIH